ncbi:MAG: hypothetical protein QXD32_05590, partial [Nitrososphaerota archaeon]
MRQLKRGPLSTYWCSQLQSIMWKTCGQQGPSRAFALRLAEKTNIRSITSSNPPVSWLGELVREYNGSKYYDLNVRGFNR